MQGKFENGPYVSAELASFTRQPKHLCSRDGSISNDAHETKRIRVLFAVLMDTCTVGNAMAEWE